MNTTIQAYNNNLEFDDKTICDTLANIIDQELPKATSKIWHRNPVWFLEGNPILGYSKQKKGIVLMFLEWTEFWRGNLAKYR